MKQIGFWAGGALLLASAVSPVKAVMEDSSVGVVSKQDIEWLANYLKVIEPALAKPGDSPPRAYLMGLIQTAYPKFSKIQAAGILHMLELVYPDRGIPPYVRSVSTRRASELPPQPQREAQVLPQIRPQVRSTPQTQVQPQVAPVPSGTLPSDEEILRKLHPLALAWAAGKQPTYSDWIQWLMKTSKKDEAFAKIWLDKLNAYHARLKAAVPPTIVRTPVAVPQIPPPPPSVTLPPLAPLPPLLPPTLPLNVQLPLPQTPSPSVTPALPPPPLPLNVPLPPPPPPAGPPPPPPLNVPPLPPRESAKIGTSKPKVDAQKTQTATSEKEKPRAGDFAEGIKKLKPAGKKPALPPATNENPVVDILGKAMDARRKALKEDVEVEEDLRSSKEWEQ